MLATLSAQRMMTVFCVLAYAGQRRSPGRNKVDGDVAVSVSRQSAVSWYNLANARSGEDGSTSQDARVVSGCCRFTDQSILP